ncbi:MAG: DNA starvation/stationary phase protection protein Dps [Planctomycetota bacterium]
MSKKMHSSPSPLSPASRLQICEALRAVLTDGLDLYTQLKVAHWNIKGPHFAALHPLFDQFATDQAANNDAVAERVLTLGHLAVGTARHVAKASRLPDYPQQTTKDLEHVALLAERIGMFLDGVRTARAVAQKNGDEDTFDLLTGMVEQFEKHAWFLHATLGG